MHANWSQSGQMEPEGKKGQKRQAENLLQLYITFAKNHRKEIDFKMTQE